MQPITSGIGNAMFQQRHRSRPVLALRIESRGPVRARTALLDAEERPIQAHQGQISVAAQS